MKSLWGCRLFDRTNYRGFVSVVYEHTETEGVCIYQLKVKMTKFGTYAQKYILRETRGKRILNDQRHNVCTA